MPGGETGAAVRPLERGLAVLRAMADPGGQGKERFRPAELVHATGLPRSTVDRVVATLAHLGYVHFDGVTAAPAPRLMELGNAYLDASGLPGALAGRAARLADELDESVSLAVPDGDGVRFVAQATRRRTMALAFRMGDLLPAERCAPGALFAAAWDAARWRRWRERHAADPCDAGFPAVPRRRPGAGGGEPGAVEAEFARRAGAAGADGWAVDDQLIEPGLVAVCVPVHGPDGSPACALSVVSHTSRHDAPGLARAVLPRLREASAEMTAALGGPVQGPDGGGGFADAAGLPGAKAELGAGYLQSLARGLAVLRALGRARGAGLPLTALAEATGLPRATTRRMLHALETLGYAAATDPSSHGSARAAGRLFRPLPRVLELGHARLSGLSFADIVQPHLRRLVDRVDESASVTVLDEPERTDIRYLARVDSSRVLGVSIAPGTRFPAYVTAMGRVLLAGLPAPERAAALARARPRAHTPHTVTAPSELAALVERAAREGSAVVGDELEEGLRSVAVPLRAADGRVLAAVNIARHSGTGSAEDTRRELLPHLRETAAAMEADLRVAGRHQPLRTS
ncbi:IclR family transcriptional regulator C-terminal domain-containing protein [Streptomyces sp. HNM0574]|uniref:IclR family transcriptional regulator domain-containing protein n=1 Tax=Streptomyces sp. HNM0574 TaxID=2714954 RepID=UPI00146CD1F0|nr:IclR family transcriptional regulator C-terminal domain-containing protein [Streptomyces sp. HNM0574]NLU70418.1 helix-turn-helix domain-containing protein [Streptomyces sp. HNM0574]